MKTSVIFTAALCVLSTASCIHDKPADTTRELRFSVSTENGFSLAEGPLSRAPIYSAQAAQSIADVRIHVFRTPDGGATHTYVRSFDISASWRGATSSAIHSVQRAELLDNGSYRFLAVGMDTATDYTIAPALAPGTAYTTVAATLATSPQHAHELFSGFADRNVGSSATNVEITMARRVSGVLLYVQNVPTRIDGTPTAFLRLTLARSNNRVDIASNPDDNVDPANVSGPGYNIFDIDLRPQGDTSPADGMWDGSTPPAGVVKLPATTLAGAYLLPGMYSEGPTMRLSLVGADGSTVLKSWSVLDISNLTTFFLWPNYLYSLGRKLQPGNTDNNTPGDPADDDTPLDLSRAQTLGIGSNDIWSNIYPMSLQDN